MKQYTRKVLWEHLPQKKIVSNSICAIFVIIFFIFCMISVTYATIDTNSIGMKIIGFSLNVLLFMGGVKVFKNYFLLFIDIAFISVEKLTFRIEMPTVDRPHTIYAVPTCLLLNRNEFYVCNEKNQRIAIIHMNPKYTKLILRSRPQSITYYGLKRSFQFVDLISVNVSNSEVI